MANGRHTYEVVINWTGNRGPGTLDYKAYGREHLITAGTKPPIVGSSDPAFRGDAARWNPEDLVVAALSACHQLWYLHLCSANGIAVLAYEDRASGSMIVDGSGGGHFTRAVLRPRVTVRAGDDHELALSLHHEAHVKCFVANSVNFEIALEPTIVCEGTSAAAPHP